VIRELKSPAVKLANATPNLIRTFGVLNHLFNIVGFNPHGTRQHGYLWWLSWLGHVGRTVFGVQDGNGDYRQAFLYLSCASIAQILNSFNPQLLQLVNNLNLIGLLGKAGVCPSQAAAINKAYAKYKATGKNPTSPLPNNASPTAVANAASALSVLTQGSGKDLKALGLQNLDLKHMFLPTLPTK